MCWVETEPDPWGDSWLAVIYLSSLWLVYGRHLTVTTPEMLVGANSSTHSESKQTVVAKVKPQEATQGSYGSLPHLLEPVVTLEGANYKRPGFLGQVLWGDGHRLTHIDGKQHGVVPAFCQTGFPSLTPPSHLDRYSAVRDLLAELEQETRGSLKTLFGLSEITSRKRREAESWSSARKGTGSKFLNLIPLLAFEKGETSKARDFRTGRKRKVSGRIVHTASDVVHVYESKGLVGFQLVRCTSSRFRGMGWDSVSREVSPLPLAL